MTCRTDRRVPCQRATSFTDLEHAALINDAKAGDSCLTSTNAIAHTQRPRHVWHFAAQTHPTPGKRTCKLFSACRMSPSAVNTMASRPSSVRTTWHAHVGKRAIDNGTVVRLQTTPTGSARKPPPARNPPSPRYTLHRYDATLAHPTAWCIEEWRIGSAAVTRRVAAYPLARRTPQPANARRHTTHLDGLDDLRRIVARQCKPC